MLLASRAQHREHHLPASVSPMKKQVEPQHLGSVVGTRLPGSPQDLRADHPHSGHPAQNLPWCCLMRYYGYWSDRAHICLEPNAASSMCEMNEARSEGTPKQKKLEIYCPQTQYLIVGHPPPVQQNNNASSGQSLAVHKF